VARGQILQFPLTLTVIHNTRTVVRVCDRTTYDTASADPWSPVYELLCRSPWPSDRLSKFHARWENKDHPVQSHKRGTAWGA